MIFKINPLAPAISIVIPVYGNATTLFELTSRLAITLGKAERDYQIIFVNDASPDNSAAILNAISTQDPRVLIVHLHERVGQHRAIRLGLQYAKKDLIAIMDADLQDPPETLSLLIKDLIARQALVAFADRQGIYESTGRIYTSWLFKKIRSFVAGVPPRASLFLVMTQAATARLLDFHAPRPFLVSMIGVAGLTATITSIKRIPRPYGRSAYSNWGRLKVGVSELAWLLAWLLLPHLQKGYRNRYLPPDHFLISRGKIN